MTINALGQAILIVGFAQFFFYPVVLLLSKHDTKEGLVRMVWAVWGAMLAAAITLTWAIEKMNEVQT